MIHQYKLNGYNIVIDVYSGEIYQVDDVAYDIIRFFDKETKEDIRERVFKKYAVASDLDETEFNKTYEDIVNLKKHGKLFSQDPFADKVDMIKERHSDIKALCLHVSHLCDLTCSYCFAGQGRFKGKSALMPFDTAKRAIDFLIEESGERRNLEVDFFGGEPLLNFDVVKQTVAYARSLEKKYGKHFRFTLTTNGTHIDDELIDFVNRECYNVVLSLDGRKEIHDRERKTRDGRGSYDDIVPKFQKLVKKRKGKNYYMRGTFTHANPDFTKDLYHMLDLGFTELSMEPVVCDPHSRFALTEDDLKIVEKEYEKLAEDMVEREKEGRGFTFYHYILDLEHGPCVYKRIAGCGSGSEYFAVTPGGELYPCHRFVGEEAYKVGDIWKGLDRYDIVDKFRSCNIYTKKECRDCWARLFCSGGCAANAYNATGSIEGVYEQGCRLFKKRMECAIMMQVALSDDGDEAGD